MNVTLAITPGGHLRAVDDAESTPALSAVAGPAVRDAFGISSGTGLHLLASQLLDDEVPPALVFWRGLARQFFQAVCHLGDAPPAKWKALAPPDEEALAALVLEAPPMQGLEYLNAELL